MCLTQKDIFKTRKKSHQILLELCLGPWGFLLRALLFFKDFALLTIIFLVSQKDAQPTGTRWILVGCVGRWVVSWLNPISFFLYTSIFKKEDFITEVLGGSPDPVPTPWGQV